MIRKSMTIGLLLGIAILVSAATNEALAADSLSVTRSDGTLDAFAVIPCSELPDCAPPSVGVRHTAIANNGLGTVFSDDVVGIPGPVCNPSARDGCTPRKTAHTGSCTCDSFHKMVRWASTYGACLTGRSGKGLSP